MKNTRISIPKTFIEETINEIAQIKQHVLFSRVASATLHINSVMLKLQEKIKNVWFYADGSKSYDLGYSYLLCWFCLVEKHGGQMIKLEKPTPFPYPWPPEDEDDDGYEGDNEDGYHYLSP